MKQFKLIRIHSDYHRILTGEGHSFAIDFPWIENLLEVNSRIGYGVCQMAIIPPMEENGMYTSEGFLFLLEREAPPESEDDVSEESDDTIDEDEDDEDEDHILTKEDIDRLLTTDRLPPHAKLRAVTSLSEEELAALCDELCPPSLR